MISDLCPGSALHPPRISKSQSPVSEVLNKLKLCGVEASSESALGGRERGEGEKRRTLHPREATMGKKEGDGKACASALAIKKGGAAGGVTKQAAATGGGGKASKGAPEKAGKRAVEKNDDCDLDDIFAAKTKGGSSGAVKAGKGGEGDADDAKSGREATIHHHHHHLSLRGARPAPRILPCFPSSFLPQIRVDRPLGSCHYDPRERGITLSVSPPRASLSLRLSVSQVCDISMRVPRVGKAKKERDAEIAAEEARYKGTTGKGETLPNSQQSTLSVLAAFCIRAQPMLALSGRAASKRSRCIAWSRMWRVQIVASNARHTQPTFRPPSS